MYSKKQRRVAGFTLIELMVVIVIVGILSAVAVPSYQRYVRSGNAAMAKQFLLDVANRQAQFMLDARRYGTTLAELNMDTAVPDRVDNNYTITITANNGVFPRTFTATATPKSGSQQDGEATLSIDYQGSKSPADEWN